MSQHPTPWRVEQRNGWPAIICADGSERWPNSVWRGSPGAETLIMEGICKAVNAFRKPAQ